MRLIRKHLLLLAVAAAVGVLFGIDRRPGLADETLGQSGSSSMMYIPHVGADSVPDFQSIMPPAQAGEVCYLLGVRETRIINGMLGPGWRDSEPRLERGGGGSGAGEGFWAERVLARNDLVPVSAKFVVRKFDSVQEGPTQLPRELPGGSFEFAGWVETPIVESDSAYVELCIQWGPRSQTAVNSDGQLKTGSAAQGGLVELDESAPGAAFVDPNYRSARRLGTDGLVGPGAIVPLGVTPGSGPFQTVVTLNAVDLIPGSAQVTTTGIFSDYVAGTTGVSFDFIEPVGSFAPTFQCDTPLGPGAITLPYPVWPGTHQPFVLNFPTAALPPAVEMSDFVCQVTGGTPLASASNEAGVIVVPENWTTIARRDAAGAESAELLDLVASVRIFNPSLVPITLTGWSLSQFLEDGGIPVAYQAHSLDGITIPAGGSVVVMLDDPLSIYAQLLFAGPEDPARLDALELPQLESVFNIFRRP